MRRKHDLEAGQQMVLVSLMLPVLLLFVGLVVDVGNLYFHRRMVQNAADAAAMAGAVQLAVSQPKAQNTALAYAATNGYNNDGANNTVDVNFPSGCLRVIVTEQVRPLLVSLVWNGTFPVSARAGACAMNVAVSASVIVLEPQDPDALVMSGGALLQVNRGNVHVNSRSSDAVSLSGNARIVTQTPTTIVGGYSTSGNASISPEPTSGPALLDPLRSLPTPSDPGSCKTITKSATLNPGCYSIKLSGSNKVTLQPGIYWIKGGLSLSGKAELSGQGVMLYIADDDVDLSGGGKVALTPPSSGVYAGVTFFGARSEIIDFKLTGGSALSELEGIVYSPNGTLTLSGGSTMRANFAVNKLEMSGSGNLAVDGYTSTNWATTEYRLTE